MSGSASTNTSATGSYVLDRPPGPPTSEEIERIVQNAIATLANLPGTLTRPRWQPMPATQPPAEVTWCSVGVQRVEADEFPDIRHIDIQIPEAGGRGADLMKRHSTITVLATFYGPEAEDAAAQLRDALYIPQQMEMMKPLKMMTVRDLARAPELINQQYINRVDLEIDFRAQFDRIYPILHLVGADLVIRTDDGAEPTPVVVRPDTELEGPPGRPTP